MATIKVFNNVSLDGYFTDANNDMSWAHANADDEWQAFAAENAQQRGGILLFGRITFQMMASYWPTAEARRTAPAVAERMNSGLKIVASRSLDKVSWQNTRIIKGDLVDEVRALKRGDQPIVIMGSGTIVSQLTSAGLIDEYQLVFQPFVLGAGRTLFEGVERRLSLELTTSRSFKNGNVVNTYRAT